MDTKYNLKDVVYYADLGNIKVHKSSVVGIQLAVEMPEPMYGLDTGVILSEQDIHSTFDEAKNQILNLAKEFEGIDENTETKTE